MQNHAGITGFLSDFKAEDCCLQVADNELCIKHCFPALNFLDLAR